MPFLCYFTENHGGKVQILAYPRIENRRPRFYNGKKTFLGGERMNEIYVTGHRNPDTDSIVAAMSYAALRNALGDRQYVAAHLGHVSDETGRMLKHFGFDEPMALRTVRTQVCDLDYDTPPCLSSSVTMDRAWHVMHEQRISAVPW